MKTILLRNCRRYTRIVKLVGEYAYQQYDPNSSMWTTNYTGSLRDMLNHRYYHMKSFIRENTDQFNVVVVC